MTPERNAKIEGIRQFIGGMTEPGRIQMLGALIDELFDPHAIIRKLAEAEWSRRTNLPFEGEPARLSKKVKTVPFASLRVECLNCIGHEIIHRYESNWECPICHNRRFIAEPNVEKACSRIFWSLPPKVQGDIIADVATAHAESWPEAQKAHQQAVLRTAEAWLDEQRKEAQG